MKKEFLTEQFASAAFKDRLAEYIMPFGGNKQPLDAILDSLSMAPYNCQSAVFELHYVDKDYQDEYAAFYCKAFKKYPSRCVRVHFFGCAIPPATRDDFARFKDGYLGYMIIRPTDLHRIGRTVLRTNLTDANRQFFHCTVPCHAHLLGQKLSVSGMPFIQQDTQVGACAQASLWMLARYMSAKFGYREYLPSEINELAKSNLATGRHLPAEGGLHSFQILDALKGMGIPAIIYGRAALKDCSRHIETSFPINQTATQEVQNAQRELQNTVKLADITYRYVESSLPVIIGTNDHALVAIGHTYDPATQATVAIQRIPAFYVNNDNKGPYREMPVFSKSPTDYYFEQVQCVIPVLPREVTLRGEEAETMARKCLEEFLNLGIPGYSMKVRDLAEKINPHLVGTLENMEYRTFLQASVEFQSALRDQMASGSFSRDVGAELLALDYPKYIWVTEISSSKLLNHPDNKDRKCIGRIIVDSTAPAKTEGVMAMHAVDFLQAIDRGDSSNRFMKHYPGSTPFGHKVLMQH